MNSGEELSMKRDSKARGTEAGASFACLGNSKDVSVADVAGEMGRGEGVGDRVVARSQIILKMGDYEDCLSDDVLGVGQFEEGKGGA